MFQKGAVVYFDRPFPVSEITLLGSQGAIECQLGRFPATSSLSGIARMHQFSPHAWGWSDMNRVISWRQTRAHS